MCVFFIYFKVFNEDDAEMSRDIDSVNMTKMPFICLSKNVYKIFFSLFSLFLDFKIIHIKLMHSQTSETVEAIVAQLMEKQRNARQNALVKQLDQNCAESSCVSNGKHSFNTTTRNIHSKSYNDMLKRSDSVEHVSNVNFNTFESKVSHWISRCVCFMRVLRIKCLVVNTFDQLVGIKPCSRSGAGFYLVVSGAPSSTLSRPSKLL